MNPEDFSIELIKFIPEFTLSEKYFHFEQMENLRNFLGFFGRYLSELIEKSGTPEEKDQDRDIIKKSFKFTNLLLDTKDPVVIEAAILAILGNLDTSSTKVLDHISEYLNESGKNSIKLFKEIPDKITKTVPEYLLDKESYDTELMEIPYIFSNNFIGIYIKNLIANKGTPQEKAGDSDIIKRGYEFINYLFDTQNPELINLARDIMQDFMASKKVLKLATKYLNKEAKKVLKDGKDMFYGGRKCHELVSGYNSVINDPKVNDFDRALATQLRDKIVNALDVY